MSSPEIPAGLYPIVDQALGVRAFESQLLALFGEGHIRGTVHTCLGQELLACSISSHLRGDDFVFGTHRGHGHFLAKTGDYRGLAAEILGRETGVSLGVGGSQHLHANGILTNGVQGGLVPIAAGAASNLANGIAVAVIGDGTLGQGILYETLNIARLQAVPLLIVVEDNAIAQTTPQEQSLAGSIRSRFEAFDWMFYECSDNDLEELHKTSWEAVNFVRTERIPAALHIRTKRLGPHSKGDDTRSKDLLSELERDDLLNRILASSRDANDSFEIHRERVLAMTSEVLEHPPASFAPNSSKAQSTLLAHPISPNTHFSERTTIRQQLTLALRKWLSDNPRNWFLGEDIQDLPSEMGHPYPGAFGVAGDLASSFPGQVRNFPISEPALTGFGLGRAMSGAPTIIEIMFGDFTTLVVDQIRQQASKLAGVYGHGLPLPFVLRTPMGGRRGYGPTHSQSFEGLFFGIPNVVLYAVSPFGVSEELFTDLEKLEIPTVVAENKDLYGLAPRNSVSPLYSLTPPTSSFQPWVVAPRSHRASATIVTYGHAAELVLQALDDVARRHEIFVDVLIYEVLSPLDIQPIHTSLKRTARLLTIEEGMAETGIFATVAAGLAATHFTHPLTLGSLGATGDIGASTYAEENALINKEKIMQAIQDVVVGESR